MSLIVSFPSTDRPTIAEVGGKGHSLIRWPRRACMFRPALC